MHGRVAEARHRGHNSQIENARRAFEAIRPLIAEATTSGQDTPQRLANFLNARGPITSRGNPWSRQAARLLLKKMAPWGSTD